MENSIVENKVGRPLKFQNVEELKQRIDKYFIDCTQTKRPLTISGLAVALDTSRKVLIDYENRGDEFSNTIKKAKSICENFTEEYLFTGKNVAGAIFNLKNNYGWQDKSEIDHTITAKQKYAQELQTE